MATQLIKMEKISIFDVICGLSLPIPSKSGDYINMLELTDGL